jgi:hypothetical protein
MVLRGVFRTEHLQLRLFLLEEAWYYELQGFHEILHVYQNVIRFLIRSSV